MKLSSNVDRGEDDLSIYSQRSEKKSSSYRQYRSNTPSSSTSKSSHDELFISIQRSMIGPILLFKENILSNENENLRGTPLIFVGAEKFVRNRFDWNKIRYPLNSSQIEVIIDLISSRSTFVREIVQLSQLNFYRRLSKTLRGQDFFDGEHHRAAEHQCQRKDSSRKFTIDDLKALDRREFHLIQYNATRDQRYQNLIESLQPIYEFPSPSG